MEFRLIVAILVELPDKLLGLVVAKVMRIELKGAKSGERLAK